MEREQPLNRRPAGRPTTRRAVGVAAALLTATVTVGTAVPATAAPAKAGSKVCTINDQRITAISGLAATSSGYAVINNTGGGSMSVYQLDSSCQVTNVVTDPNTPRDPEDLAATSDGSMWVADFGDKDKSRDTIALWKFSSGNSQATLYRMKYPSGAGPVDARSLLMQPNGTPVVVTYQAGAGKVFVPTGKLSADSPTPLKAAGSIPLTATGTPGSPIGQIGQRVFTGGAVSPDGKRAVLRTYTDAYEWDVTGGDVAKSITAGKPRRTALPNETGSGESITYTKDSSSFLTVGDTENIQSPSQIVKYTPSTQSAPTKAAPSAAGKATSDGGGLFSGNISLSDITTLVVAVGIAGLLLVIVGVVGIRRSRRRGPPDDGRKRGNDPNPRGPAPRRSGTPQSDDVETAYIPRVTDSAPSERRASTLRGEAPPRSRRHAAPADDDADTEVFGRITDSTPPPRNAPPPRGAPHRNVPPPPPRNAPPPSRNAPPPPPRNVPPPAEPMRRPPRRSEPEPPPYRSGRGAPQDEGRREIDWLDDLR
ncbi:hypothetical protein GCM10022220_45360 [Actinocatenispora rupis]|uniref:Uncharacterized protein n=2 Tax=Actinocatenispora rupis TaxID=519421 RepID=A0A8J3ND67_9ACTN|nr:hypothetical protein Aru02nite_56400 [Actinocatenispora rupis]